jgi:hypothetical protein
VRDSLLHSHTTCNHVKPQQKPTANTGYRASLVSARSSTVGPTSQLLIVRQNGVGSAVTRRSTGIHAANDWHLFLNVNRNVGQCSFLLRYASHYIFLSCINRQAKKKSKTIPVTGRGGLYGCEMLRIPHCLDNRLTDGGKVASPTHRPRSTPQKHYYFYVSGTHFC